MEIQETTALKYLKKNLESSVEKILSRHENLTELPEEDFDNLVDSITKSEEISRITKKFLEYHNFTESGKQQFIEQLDRPELYDETKLENIVNQLMHSKSTEVKVSSLQLLMNYPVIDIVDKRKWPKISKALKEALLHRNMAVFLNALKVHVKLSLHPDGIIEATSNILQSLMVIFNSKRISTHVAKIDLKVTSQEQIMKLVSLLLNNFGALFKNYNTQKEKRPDNLIIQLMELLICHKNYDRTDYIHIFYYIFVLDPHAKWFQQLMHFISTRKTVIGFCYKNNAFLKYILKEIITNINSETVFDSRKTISSEISLDVIKYCALSHCCKILSAILTYKWGQKLFPIEIKSSDTTLQSLIIIIINSIQNLSNLKSQYYKKELLTELLKTILVKNRSFLYNKDIVQALVKPFLFKINEKQKLLQIVNNNKHVLEIINSICNTQDAFFIIFGFADIRAPKKRQNQYIRSISLQDPLVISNFIEKYTKQHHCSATERDNISMGKTLVEFTSNFTKYAANSCEKNSQIDDTIYDLLESCCNIHSLHTHVIMLVNSQKLLQACLELYKVLIDKDLIMNSMNSLLKFFITICGSQFGTNMFYKEDTELLYILCKHYFFIFDNALNNHKHFFMFFVNLANTIPGCIAINECKKQIISPYLNKIWKIDEDQMTFLSGSHKLLEEECFKYYKFIFLLQLNFTCVQALLTSENDDESTIIDSDDKPNNLQELIEEAMCTSGPGTCPCFVGLQTIRILINNMDILIFLENAADLKDQVSILQLDCASEHRLENSEKVSETSIIIDECSLLRKNIINYIQNIGFVKSGSSKSRSQQRLQSTTISARNRRLHEFQKFLNDSRNNLHDNNWLLQARKLFRQTCSLNFKESTFADLVQQIRLTVPNGKNHFIWPENDKKLNDLFPEDNIGVRIIVNFGKNNKLLQLPNQYEEVLALLLKQVNCFLNKTRDKFEGFDWFVGVIFLMCGGNIDRSKIVLQCMVQFPVGPFIWPSLGQQLGVLRNFDYAVHFDHTLNKLIGDLEIFVPALEEAGISWNFIVKNWINQCFFNVLGWSELCNFLSLIILYPVEYLLFFIVCSAQHLERKFLDAITSSDINNYLNIMQLTGFHIVDYFNSLDQLGRQYKNILYK